MENDQKIEIKRGLKGVYFDRSNVTMIDGKAGELRFRGYSIHDLATQSSFEETAYLLLQGNLPNAKELADFDAALKEARTLPTAIHDLINLIQDAHPMDVLRTATSALAAFDPEAARAAAERLNN